MPKILTLCTLYLNRVGINLPHPGNLYKRRTVCKVIVAKLSGKNIWIKFR